MENISKTPINLKGLHEHLLEIYTDQIDIFKKTFNENKAFTNFINNTVAPNLSKKLDLHYLSEYYSIDYVFYKNEDLVTSVATTWDKKESNIWLKRIRVAFEHENCLYGSSGGYQEFSHLMLTNAEAKVLIGYGKWLESYDSYAFDYQSLMQDKENSDQILFIGEWDPKDKPERFFESYILSSSGVQKYDFEDKRWKPLDIKNEQ
jgi:hypothetical protein